MTLMLLTVMLWLLIDGGKKKMLEQRLMRLVAMRAASRDGKS